MTPIRSGSMPHSSAWLRTRLIARCASSNAPGAGCRSGSPGRRGTRYFRTTPVIPRVFSHAATSSPSLSHARFQYPPPGQIRIATPARFAAAGWNTDIVGRVTFVIHPRVFCRRLRRCPFTLRTDLPVISHRLPRPDIQHQRRIRPDGRADRTQPDRHARQDQDSSHRRCLHGAGRQSHSHSILRALRRSVKDAGAGRCRSPGHRPTSDFHRPLRALHTRAAHSARQPRSVREALAGGNLADASG